MSAKKATKKVTKRIRSTPEQFVQQCIIGGYIHHYDFEFNSQERLFFPIELGISTYTMQSNREIDSFHILINSNPTTPFPQQALQTHGIPEEVVFSASNDYRFICNQILQYLDKFQDKPSVFVLKDEIVGGDKKCLDILFKNANMTNNLKYKKIKHITHHTLLSEWMKMNHINVQYNKNFINSLYKNTTKTNEKKCDYHKTVELEYHCALEDSRNTAISIYYAMNHFKQNSFMIEMPLEKIPIISNEFSMDAKAVVFHIQGYKYDEPYKGRMYGTVREACYSVIDLQTGTVDKRQSFIFMDEEPWELQDHEDKRIISELFREKQLTNLEVARQISGFLADLAKQHKIMVIGKSGDLKMIPHFPLKNYALFPFDKFILNLQKGLGEKYHLDDVNAKLFKIFKKNAEVKEMKECEIHMKYQLKSECAVEDNYQFIGYVQYFIEEFKSIYEQFNNVEDDEEEPISPITSNSVSPSLTPRISCSPSPDVSDNEDDDDDEEQISPREKKTIQSIKPIPQLNHPPIPQMNHPPIKPMPIPQMNPIPQIPQMNPIHVNNPPIPQMNIGPIQPMPMNPIPQTEYE